MFDRTGHVPTWTQALQADVTLRGKIKCYRPVYTLRARYYTFRRECTQTYLQDVDGPIHW